MTAEDDDGVGEVKMYFRQTGAQFWENIVMTEVGDEFTASIDSVSVPGVDFYFRATDSGNPIAYSLLPEPVQKYHFPLQSIPSPYPFHFMRTSSLKPVKVL